MQNKKFLVIGLGLFALTVIGGVYWVTMDAAQLQGRLDQVLPVVETTTESPESLAAPETSVSDDSDGDGLSDEDELSKYNSDPRNPDSDGGGLEDGSEIETGRDPLDPRDDQ